MYSVLCVIPRMIVKISGSLVLKVLLVSSLDTLLILVLTEFTIVGQRKSWRPFEQRSLKPGLQCMTSGQISSGLDLTYAPSTITTQQPTERKLDSLFEAMYDDYFGGQPSANVENVSTAQEPQVCQTSTASTSSADNVPIPTNSS
nr:hypothetical protein [Tanacetum cinerariifolium]